MKLSRSIIFVILAVVLFLVALILTVIGHGDGKLISELTLGGLASFAAGHL